jgi:hypothetical protein
MSKSPASMPAIVNRKTNDETPSDEPLETKSEGDEAVEDLKEGE